MARRFGAGLAPPLAEPFTVNRDSMQAAGLVLWIPPAASRGASVLTDRGGRGHHGTFGASTAAPSWSADPVFGAGPLFDGSNDEITIDSNFTLDTSGPWSVAVWGFCTSSYSGNSAFPTPWGLKTDQSGPFILFPNSAAGYNGVNFGNGTGAGPFVRLVGGPVGSAMVNVVRHIVVTYDGSGRTTNAAYALYVDGVGYSLANDSGISGSTNASYLGRYGGSTGFWTGRLGDFRVYNQALSPAAVWQLYDPQTRWELYRPSRWRVLVQGGGSAPATTGTAAILGAGRLAATAAKASSTTVAMRSAGRLAAATTKGATATAALAAAARIATASVKASSAATSERGTGLLATAATASRAAVVALRGAGLLRSAGGAAAPEFSEAAAVRGMAWMQATSVRSSLGTAALSGSGRLAGAAVRAATAQAVLRGHGRLAGVASPARLSVAALRGQGRMQIAAGTLTLAAIRAAASDATYATATASDAVYSTAAASDSEG